MDKIVPYNGRQWQQQGTKARRPLSSVYLAEGQKQKLLGDVTEYLDDKTKQWHEERSIPHRRGYLFHGPPGTGKTTFAMAIAGHFKLQVYVLSLLDPHVDDTALLILFQSIRKGVLLLLEDVDCCGIGRRARVSSRSKTKPRYDSEGNEIKEEKSNVSLSGLLNAIDGAGAPEGHILIMTTNDPDSLDAALVRAGRVDTRVPFNVSASGPHAGGRTPRSVLSYATTLLLTISFQNATKSQIRDIFVNMYLPFPKEGVEGSYESSNGNGHTNGVTNGHITNGHIANGYITNGHIETNDQEGVEDEKLMFAKEVHRQADRFMNKIPDGKFSPAQLQGYIMFYKDRPADAVDDVEDWIEERLEIEAKKGESAQAGQVAE